MTDGPVAKKARTNPAELPRIVQPSHFTDEARAAGHERFTTSTPYTHVVLRDLFDDGLLRRVRDEIINNLQATYKETDLFKVFQTGDMAALDPANTEHASKLGTLLQLRAAIYSEPFRQLVRDLTGCGELSDKTDCSCNVYSQGGHLLCHDDVIGTRRVSYIIYLTDPDTTWQPQDGGALELFPMQPDGKTPDSTPTVSHLPFWNSMAMFTVQPGRSFHSVQEVFTDANQRMSISGWYHAAEAPEGSEKASLQQLQLRAGEDNTARHTPFEGPSTDSDLTEADRELLRRYVNPVYLEEAAWAKVRAKFQEDGSCQLHRFLVPELAARILAAARKADTEQKLGNGQVPDYSAGVGGNWNYVGPPHKQRYLRYEGPAAANAESDEAGALLAEVREQLFCSGAFARLLRSFTTIAMLGHTGEVRRFRPGLDYTVAHYGILTADPRLDAVLCFVEDAAEGAAAGWECGEVGGFEAYLLADESEADKGAAAVYRAGDEDSGVLNVGAAANCLNLVLRDEGLMRFVKYVGHLAPSSRWDVCMEYLPEDDSDGEEGQEGEDGEEGGEGEGEGEGGDV